MWLQVSEIEVLPQCGGKGTQQFLANFGQFWSILAKKPRLYFEFNLLFPLPKCHNEYLQTYLKIGAGTAIIILNRDIGGCHSDVTLTPHGGRWC